MRTKNGGYAIGATDKEAYLTFANLVDLLIYDISTQKYHTVSQIVVVWINDEREEG